MLKQRIILVAVIFFSIAVFAVQTRSQTRSPQLGKRESSPVGPKVRWRFVIYEKTLHNPAIPPQDRDSNAAESLSLSCDIEMTDPRLLLGMVPGATIERITDGQGNDLSIGVGEFQSGRMYQQDSFLIKWLRFNQRIGGRNPADSRYRRSPPRLELDTRLREQVGGKIKLLKGYYIGLMAESIKYVDVPFRASDKWVRVTPELEIRVLEARNVASKHYYKIEQRPRIKPFPAVLSIGDYLPSRLVLAQQIILRNNSGVGGGGMGSSGGADGNAISTGSGIGRAERIRYLIAVNTAHEKIPFELEDIPLSALAGPTQTAAPGSEQTTRPPVMQHLRNKAVEEKKEKASVTQTPAKPTSGANRGKYFDVRWTSITHGQTLHNPALSKRGVDQRLFVRCNAEILDPKLVLGTCETPIIKQITDGKGRPADISAAEPRSNRMHYKTPKYHPSPTTTPPSTLAQMEGQARLALGLGLRQRHWPKRASELQPVRMVIRLDPGLIGQGRKEVGRIEGYIYALTAESFRNVEVPFKRSAEWVRLTSDVEIQVARAWHDGSNYRYDIKDRSQARIRPGRLYIDHPLPDAIVVNRRFTGPDVPTKRRSLTTGGNSIPMSAGGNGSVRHRVDGVDCQIKTIDYRIALNPKHHKVPFQFKHIPLP